LQFAGHIRRIENVSLVAEVGDRIVGVVDVDYHQRLGDHRPLVVTGEARGQGAGTALLARAEELAPKRGCFRMALVTAGWRTDAVAFYEREGWTNYGEWFVKPLADDVDPSGMPIRDDT